VKKGNRSLYVALVVVVVGLGAGCVPNSGTLPVLVTGFTGGNPGTANDCFPAGAGWNAYYVTGFFWGPFSSEPANAPFPNANNKAHLTIDTLATENGTTLDTGVLIAREFYPDQKVCNDNAQPPFVENPNLSSATFSNLVGGKRYRVTIFYKTTTAGGVTTVKMNWAYH